MEYNTPVIAIVVIAAIALIAFLVYRNLRDEKKFEKDIDQPAEHPHPGKNDRKPVD